MNGGRAEQQGKAKRFHAKQSKATQRHLSTAQRTGRPTQEQRRRAVVKSGQDWTGGHEWPGKDWTGQDRQAAGMEMMGWDGLVDWAKERAPVRGAG